MSSPRKNATKTRGKPFERGNPGRPKGARHRVTLAVEALLEGEAEELTRKAIEKAKEGELAALKLCLDRIAPPPKDRHVTFDMPTLETPADALIAIASIVQAVADGEVTPSEAASLVAVVDRWRAAYETTEVEARLKAIEASMEARGLS